LNKEVIEEKHGFRIGLISKNNFGTDMKIIKNITCDQVLIQFQDEHKFKKEIYWTNFQNGNVKNPYDKIRYGVGYIGAGDYKVESILGTHDKSYDAWQNMLERCYSEKLRHKHKAYEECTVCEKWHNYQNFAKWYKNNSYNLKDGRLHLDKDIKQKNNTVYSPEMCLLVPQRINMIFMSKYNPSGLPNGIRKNKNSYTSLYNGKEIDRFKTLEEAIEAHDKAKRIHIKQIAEEYKSIIPTKVYKALLAW
jgi:hypothetical protein